MQSKKDEVKYLPKPIIDIISKIDYKNIEELYIIVYLIYSRQSYFKSDLQKYYRYLEIPRSYFGKFIPKNRITELLDILIDEGVILRNDYFVYGQKAKGYKVESSLMGGMKYPIVITDKQLLKKIAIHRNNLRTYKNKSVAFTESKYYNSFTLDREPALAAAEERCLAELMELSNDSGFDFSKNQLQTIIDCTGDYKKYRGMILSKQDLNAPRLHGSLHRLMTHQTVINNICDGLLFFKRNSTNNRLDTNLTSLPSYLRKFIKTDVELFNIDINNSQPYFLYTKLVKLDSINTDELKTFGDSVVSGLFYEMLGSKWTEHFGRPTTRVKMKKLIFDIFFSKVGNKQKQKEFFREIFPTIMDFIDSTNYESNSRLANMLSERESMVVLDVVMPKLEKLGIKPYTIHDSYIVTENEKDVVKRVFENTCIEMYGIAPTLTVESLTDAKDEEVIDEAEAERIANYDFGDGFEALFGKE